MKHLFLFCLILILPAAAFAQDLSLVDLRCEHRNNPIGIGALAPRLSWKSKTVQRNWKQAAYQIQVAGAENFAPKSIVWDSKKVNTDASVLQPYGGPRPESGKRYFWRVKVWDDKGMESTWSPVAFWEMGLLSAGDWKAKWIESPLDSGTRYQPALLMRKEFNLRKKVARARAYVTAHGLYELYLNGQKIGDQVLTPGWTVYAKRLQYQTYDVTAQLVSGPNAVGAMLGEGWYRGGLAWEANWAIYGKKLGLLCQINIQYTDGSAEWVVSDDGWQSSNQGPVRKNELYYGEAYDAQMEQNGWDKAGFDARAWSKTVTAPHPLDNLVAPEGVPVRRISEVRPLSILKRGQNSWMVDMGQNMVGWVQLKVRGTRGEQLFLRHGEVLDNGGPLYTDNLRGAKQLISYTLKGGGEEVFEPRFTFMGFRYVNVVNYPGELTPDDITGIVVHSDMPPSGTFECSNALINQLQKNIVWGQKGNFLDVPTDCPQRDERLGWTGDAQVFARTAAFNMDVAAFFDKWLRDVAASQKPNGAVPHVIPDVLNKQNAVDASVSAGWGDAAVIIPWTMYQVYADRQMLERQYPSMKAYVDYIRSKSGENLIWKGGSVFGDWLFYRPNPKDHPAPDAYTNHDYISTAFFAYSADLVRKSAEVLGKNDDAAFYGALYEKVKKAFVREYVTPAGRTTSDSQTSYVLALMFGLMPEESRSNAAQYLMDDIRSRKNHLSTGFLGTPYLCHVLTQNGATDLAYQLLLQQSYPSWLYPVKMGATTIWERWDGQKTDGSYQDAGMNSFNHYAYGAIGDWMYQVAAGIQAGQPGYKEIVIAPHPTDSLQYVRATYESIYGQIASSWERVGEKIVLKVTIPANTSALIKLENAEAESIRENGKNLSEVTGIKLEGTKDVALRMGSGFYMFEYKFKRKL